MNTNAPWYHWNAYKPIYLNANWANRLHLKLAAGRPTIIDRLFYTLRRAYLTTQVILYNHDDDVL